MVQLPPDISNVQKHFIDINSGKHTFLGPIYACTVGPVVVTIEKVAKMIKDFFMGLGEMFGKVVLGIILLPINAVRFIFRRKLCSNPFSFRNGINRVAQSILNGLKIPKIFIVHLVATELLNTKIKYHEALNRNAILETVQPELEDEIRSLKLSNTAFSRELKKQKDINAELLTTHSKPSVLLKSIETFNASKLKKTVTADGWVVDDQGRLLRPRKSVSDTIAKFTEKNLEPEKERTKIEEAEGKIDIYSDIKADIEFSDLPDDKKVTKSFLKDNLPKVVNTSYYAELSEDQLVTVKDLVEGIKKKKKAHKLIVKDEIQKRKDSAASLRGSRT